MVGSVVLTVCFQTPLKNPAIFRTGLLSCWQRHISLMSTLTSLLFASCVLSQAAFVSVKCTSIPALLFPHVYSPQWSAATGKVSQLETKWCSFSNRLCCSLDLTDAEFKGGFGRVTDIQWFCSMSFIPAPKDRKLKLPECWRSFGV